MGYCPSLHVAYSIGIAVVWCRRKETLNGQRILIWLLVVMISLSTCFVKQHSFVDVVAAVPLGFLGDFLLYGKVGERRPKLQELLENI